MPSIYSIDRLATILANDFFPHYRYWRNTEPRHSQEYVDLTRAGHDLWSADNVRQIGRKKYSYTVFSMRYVFGAG